MKTSPEYAPRSTPIAVIGLGCWYPGAADPASLWKNILARRVQFRRMPDARLPLSEYHDGDRTVPDKTYGTEAALIDGFDFPWQSYRIPKRTFESTDLAQWLALEVSLRAIRDSGYEPGDLPKDSTGVILGNTLTGEFTRSNILRLRWPYVRKTLEAAVGSSALEPEAFAAVALRMEEYFKAAFPDENEDSLAGGLSNTIAGRIANFNDFHGCGYVVDGACSSSLIAVAQGATALESGDLDLVLAGGVDISLDPFELVGFAKAGALTQGRMRVYDRRGSGFIPGEGAGFAVLKRLEDAKRDGNYVYAVLHGWGLSSDGKGGITAPSDTGQARALSRAYAKAPYSIGEVDFFEGHGTGTTVGDRIELKGIALALGLAEGAGAGRRYGVTSFKSICGHTKAAAGIGGFLKTVMAVNQRVLPPLAGCEELNPVFDAEARGLYPLRHGKVLDPAATLRAGVSAMGFGGSNSHATVVSAGPRAKKLEPAEGEEALLSSYQTAESFPFAAATREELERGLRDFAATASGVSFAEMADLSARLWRERARDLPWRAALLADSPSSLAEAATFLADRVAGTELEEGGFYASQRKDAFLSRKPDRPRLLFLYPGQGSQSMNVAAWAFRRFAWARDLLARTAALVAEESGDPGSAAEFVALILPYDEVANAAEVEENRKRLADTRYAQPAIVLQELVYTRFLQGLGLRADAVGGHSLGELSALCAAGALDEGETLALAAKRGRIMSEAAGGAMASLACDRKTAEGILGKTRGYAAVANLNGPEQTVVSGDADTVRQALESAAAANVRGTLLPVSAAFHSRHMTGAGAAFAREAGGLRAYGEGKVAFHSSVSGRREADLDDLPAHLGRQITAPVEFQAMVEGMAPGLGLEVGPRGVLSSLVERIDPGAEILPLESSSGNWMDLCRALARLHVAGFELDGAALFEGRYVLPFVEPGERAFIRNPCERPLPAAVTPKPAASALALPGIDGAALAEYLRERSGFLSRVIQADIEDRGRSPLPRPSADAITVPSVPAATAAAAAIGARAERTPAPTEGGPERVLIRLAAEKTGFDPDSLALGNKLLDDLNLDSIKAAQFINEAAKILHAQGKFDPAPLANASLGELAGLFRELAKDLPAEISEPRRASGEIRELFALVEEKTGFPAEGMEGGFRLLDDLNMDSIKAADFIRAAARLYDFRGDLDAHSMANASLETVHTTLLGRRRSEEKILKPEVSPATVLRKDDPRPAWVRSFVTKWVAEPIEASEEQEASDTAVVLAAERGATIEKIRGELARRGLKSRTIDLARIAEVRDPEERVFLCALEDARAVPGPDTPYSERLTGLCPTFLRRDLELLRNVAHLSAELASGRRPASLVFVRETGNAPQVLSEQAFFESVHLEHPRLKMRYLRLPRTMAASRLVDAVLSEMVAKKQFQISAYDHGGRRSVPLQFLTEIDDRPNGAVASMTGEDVVLVTGGGKGITAACLLAARLPVRHALLGRSPASDPEIVATLRRMEEAGLAAAYFRTDVTDEEALSGTLAEIKASLGPITGLVHGAAVNIPRRAETPSVDEVFAEISPKVVGLMNILDHCEPERLKLLAGFSSIIGVAGMAGNAWYAFANELLSGILRCFAAKRPETHTLALAYSIWGEIGMGARLGSVETLARQGVDAIPPEIGAAYFARAVRGRTEGVETVVTGRAYGLDTWRRLLPKPPADFRFARSIDQFEPGVELVTRAVLGHREDPYLVDHDYRGSLLFPTVFGIEAMAQNVCLLFGVEPARLRSIRIENLELRLPISVPAKGGTEIRIVTWATGEGRELKAHSGISCELSGFGRFHFEGDFTLATVKGKKRRPVPLPEAGALPIDPQRDLYGGVLFQGPRFRLLKELLEWREDRIVYRLLPSRSDGAGPVLGDPYARDVLLQSAQLFTPGRSCLPIRVGRWDIDLSQARGEGFCRSLVEETGADELGVGVVAWTAEGLPRETLSGYRVRYLEKEGQGLADYLEPDRWDGERLRGALLSARAALAPEADPGCLDRAVLLLRHSGDPHAMDAPARHAIEAELLGRAFPGSILGFREDGKPLLSGAGGQGVSISHDEGLFLAFAFPAETLGSDLLPLSPRKEADWLELLPPALAPRLADFADRDAGGHYLWTAFEAARKAGGGDLGGLRLVEFKAGAARFSLGDLAVLAFPLRLSRGGTRIFAFAFPAASLAAPRGPALPAAPPSPLEAGRGKSGEALFRHRFPLSFRENAALGRGLHFTNFFNWMGKVRELMLEPVSRKLAEQFATGEWGMVTNRSSTTVYGDAFHYERIEAAFRILRIYGSKDSTIEMEFLWSKITEDGRVLPIATSLQETTWFRTKRRGVVEPAPFPEYFRDFLATIAPSRPCADRAEARVPDRGARLRTWKSGPRSAFAHSEEFATSLANANLVGNNYFANYFTWQGHVADRFLHSLDPGLFEGHGEGGEFFCLYSGVDHLRESMPFDTVIAKLAPVAMDERGLEFRFEFHKKGEEGAASKLAVGSMILGFGFREAQGEFRLEPLPESIAGRLQAMPDE